MDLILVTSMICVSIAMIGSQTSSHTEIAWGPIVLIYLFLNIKCNNFNKWVHSKGEKRVNSEIR